MLGGYTHFEADAFYISDNPILSNSTKIWKWGIGGFGYSEDGVDGPYTTAVTAEGSIVAELISAGIITADMVQTGILQSEDGSTWINLDNGSFNLKNALSYENNVLTISQDFNSKIEQTVEETAIAQNVSYNGIKFSTTEGIEIFNNVPQRVIQLGGIDTNEDGTKDDYGLVVAHSDGSKTFITKDGIKRKIGSTNNYYHYLTYIGSGTSVFVNVGAEAQAQTITLPSEYKNKYFNVYVSVQSFKVWDTLIKTVEVQLNSVDRTNGTFTVTVNKNNATYTGGTVYTCIIIFQYIVIA